MKKLTSLITLLLTLAALTSCLYKSASPSELMADFLREYRGTGTVYTPEADEGEAGYVTEKMALSLFGDASRVPLDYAVYLYSGLDRLTEVGMLSSVGAQDTFDITDVCLERLKLLSAFAEGDSGIFRTGNVVIYYFSSESEIKEALLKIT